MKWHNVFAVGFLVMNAVMYLVIINLAFIVGYLGLKNNHTPYWFIGQLGLIIFGGLFLWTIQLGAKFAKDLWK